MSLKLDNWIMPITLVGNSATLEPLSQEHARDLALAVQDGELWKLWFTFIPAPESVAAEIARQLDLQTSGSMVPFAIIENTSAKAIGITTYMNIDAEAKHIEIGSTWYAQSYQRTALNTECKLLLLTHAFEKLECIAVEFRTSSFNHKSRQAIERLGAKLDGILRNHRRHKDGSLRDTYVYSILPSEWEAVKSNLKFKLENYSPKVCTD